MKLTSDRVDSTCQQGLGGPARPPSREACKHGRVKSYDIAASIAARFRLNSSGYLHGSFRSLVIKDVVGFRFLFRLTHKAYAQSTVDMFAINPDFENARKPNEAGRFLRLWQRWQ